MRFGRSIASLGASLALVTAAAGVAPAAAVGGDQKVIVVLRRRVSAASLSAAAGGSAPIRISHRYAHLNAVAATLTGAQIAALRSDPAVVRVETDRTVRLEPDATTPGQMTAPTTVRKADIGLNAAQRKLGLDGDAANDGLLTYGPADEVIAVVDSGIDPSHPDFAGKILAFQNFVSAPDPGCPTPPVPPAPWDDLGHGTHVASIATGTGAAKAANKGVAPGAALVVLKVFDCNGSAPESDILAALDWLITNKATYGVDVVNMSFGVAAAGLDGTDVLSAATNVLAASGMVPVVAAGNSGPGRGSVNAPGVARWALTTGAIKANALGRTLGEFSSRGPTGDGRIKPDVLTPGVDILAASANTPGWWYRYMSGTSMAAPLMSGVAALALQADPTLAPSGAPCPLCADGVTDASMTAPLMDLARSKAADWNVPGPDTETGWGALNAFPFLAAAAHSTMAGPAYPRHYAFQGHLADRGEQLWAVKATKNKTVGIGLTVPVADGWNGPFTRLLVFDATGAPVPVTDDCSSYDGGWWSSSLCWTNGGASRSTGVWFTPAATGTYFVGARSLAAPTDYVLDVDSITQAATSGVPVVVSGPGAALSEGGGSAGVDVSLSHQPTKNVTVQLRGDGQINLPGVPLTFTPANWSTPQTVGISAVDDAVAEGMHAGLLVAVAAGAKIGDAALSIPLSIPVADNDGTNASARVERVSLTDQGSESWGPAYDASGSAPLVTPGGGVVAFESRSVDLAGPDANGVRTDVFVRDRATGHTERISVGATGSDNYLEGISDDGSKVLISSYDPLTAGDTNSDFDLFVRDRVAGTTTRVNLTSAGAQMPQRACRTDWTQYCFELPGAISGDGSTVAFVTDAPMVPSDTDGAPDVYVRDLVTGTVERASVASDGTTGPGTVKTPYQMRVALSVDGSSVLFTTSTDGLAPGEQPGALDMFVHERSTGATTLVNSDASGVALPLSDYIPEPVLAAGGAFAAFGTTDALTGGVAVWVKDLSTGGVELADPTADGTPGTQSAIPLSITSDGRNVTFYTTYGAVPAGGGPVMRNLDTGVATPLIVGMFGGTVRQAYAHTSSDGRFATWISNDASVVAGDTNAASDVFLRTLP